MVNVWKMENVWKMSQVQYIMFLVLKTFVNMTGTIHLATLNISVDSVWGLRMCIETDLAFTRSS